MTEYVTDTVSATTQVTGPAPLKIPLWLILLGGGTAAATVLYLATRKKAS
jgi:hypothetical protein